MEFLRAIIALDYAAQCGSRTPHGWLPGLASFAHSFTASCFISALKQEYPDHPINPAGGIRGGAAA
jgi:hypothetical protein